MNWDRFSYFPVHVTYRLKDVLKRTSWNITYRTWNFMNWNETKDSRHSLLLLLLLLLLKSWAGRGWTRPSPLFRMRSQHLCGDQSSLTSFDLTGWVSSIHETCLSLSLSQLWLWLLIFHIIFFLLTHSWMSRSLQCTAWDGLPSDSVRALDRGLCHCWQKKVMLLLFFVWIRIRKKMERFNTLLSHLLDNVCSPWSWGHMSLPPSFRNSLKVRTNFSIQVQERIQSQEVEVSRKDLRVNH